MQHFGGRDSKPERKLMASVRYDRINEEIKKALSEIVREMKDPRISPMTTIMLVEATNDLKLAKVPGSVCTVRMIRFEKKPLLSSTVQKDLLQESLAQNRYPPNTDSEVHP